MSDHPVRHDGAGQREPRRTLRRGGLVWGRCRLGRWGWFDCVRSQSRPSSTHLRKGHSEWRRLGGTCRGLAGPRYSLYVRVTGKVSRRFRSSVVVSHGLPLYPSVDRGDLLRGIGQSVPDTLCRHRAPNPFAGGFTKAWDILVRILVIACQCVSVYVPLCNRGKGCAATLPTVYLEGRESTPSGISRLARGNHDFSETRGCLETRREHFTVGDAGGSPEDTVRTAVER